MKAREGLVAVCVVLLVASDSNCEHPRATYKKWAGIVETLRNNWMAMAKDEKECRASPEQTLSFVHLMFDLWGGHKKTGILNYAWPRLSFYTEALKALTEAPSLNDTVVCAALPKSLRLCLAGKCKACRRPNELQEIKDSNEETLIQICEGSYAKPPAEAEVTEEMRKELAEISKPPVASPGDLTAEEATFWMEAKLSERKEKVAEKAGDDCDAPPQLTMSLSYLRLMYKEGVTTKEAVAKELKAHSEFYAEKLKWLKGADKEIISCEEGLVCGWDGVCVSCDVADDPDRLGLKESCALEQKPEEPTPTKYGNPLEAYGSWVAAFLKVKKRSVKKNSADKSCSASVEQTISWGYLSNLFYVHQKKGVLRQAWPRISFYEQKLGEVEKAPEDAVFCDSVYGSKDGGFLCSSGECRDCKELEESGEEVELYRKWCSEELERFPWEENKPRLEEVEKLRRIEEGMETPGEKLTLEEALSWNETLGRTATLGNLEECETPPQLTLAVKTLMRRLMKVRAEGEKIGWRWRRKEEVEEANQTTYAHRLVYLKGVEKEERRFCGDDLVCGADGVCLPCAVAEVTHSRRLELSLWDLLREACAVDIPEEATKRAEYSGDHRSAHESKSSGGRVEQRGKWGVVIIFVSIFYVPFLNA